MPAHGNAAIPHRRSMGEGKLHQGFNPNSTSQAPNTQIPGITACCGWSSPVGKSRTHRPGTPRRRSTGHAVQVDPTARRLIRKSSRASLPSTLSHLGHPSHALIREPQDTSKNEIKQMRRKKVRHDRIAHQQVDCEQFTERASHSVSKGSYAGCRCRCSSRSCRSPRFKEFQRGRLACDQFGR